MSKSRVTILSSLSDIAKDIGQNFLLRPFPTKLLPYKLLDYSEIRALPLNKTWVYRPIHGYQNACRVAALIPLLFEFYQKHRSEFPLHLQWEIYYASPDKIKKIQILGLLRSVGRTEDGESGYKFCQQGKLECINYLRNLGLRDEHEIEELSTAIVDSEGGKEPDQMSLASYLLGDATVIETFRDTLSYADKALPITAFPFYRGLNPLNQETVDEFIDICCAHLEIVRAHQGFLHSAIQDGKGNPIVEYWPKLDDASLWKKNFATLIKKQLAIEYDENCFELCELAVQGIKNIIHQPPYSFDVLFQDFLLELKKSNLDIDAPLSTKDKSEFVLQFILFFKPKLGKFVLHTTNEQTYRFRLNWDSLYHYLVNEKKLIPQEVLFPINIFKEAIVVKESEDWYHIIFPSQLLAEYYLNVIKLFLHRKFFHELTKASVVAQSDKDGTYYRFRLNDRQFYSLVKALNLMPGRMLETNITELLNELNIAIIKNNIRLIKEMFLFNPALKFFCIDKITILQKAIAANHIELVKLLIEEFNYDINSQVGGMTPIMYACSVLKQMDGQIIKLLLNMPDLKLTENQTPIIRKLIRENASTFKPLNNNYIKTIRPDWLCYIDEFASELANPDIRYPKRTGPKQRYTYNGNGIFNRDKNTQDEFPLKQPQYTRDEKASYTKVQSTTLILPNFFPTAFSFIADKSVGALFGEENVLLSNRLLTHAGGTKKRPYEHTTKNQAAEYGKKKQNMIFSAKQLPEFIRQIIANGPKQTNEALVRLKWNCDGSCKIIIVSDNLNSRLLAKQYATVLLEKLMQAKKCPLGYQVPICFYTPDKPALLFKEYTDDEYLLDCHVARYLYLNDVKRKAAIEKCDFEFLLALDPQQIKIALSNLREDKQKYPLMLHLLTFGFVHIFRFLQNKSGLNLEDILGQHIARFANDQEFCFSILYHALSSDDQELANYIFSQINFLNFPKKSNLSKTPLLMAIERNFVPWVRKLIAYPCFDLEVKNKDGHTGLTYAVKHGYKESVALLLKNGAAVNSTNSSGNTSLMLAAYYGHVEIFHLLLQYHPNIEVKNKKDKDAFDHMTQGSHTPIIHLFIKYLILKNDFTNLPAYMKRDKTIFPYISNLIMKTSPEMLTVCLQSFDPNYRIQGLTPLHRLILHSLDPSNLNLSLHATNMQAIATFLELGAKIHTRTNAKQTIFHMLKEAILTLPVKLQYKCKHILAIISAHAIKIYDSNAVKELIKLGFHFDVEKPNICGETRLYQALSKTSIDLKEIGFLAELGANPNLRANSGLSSLDLAASHLTDLATFELFQNIDCIHLTSRSTHQNYKGWTFLHFAIHSNNLNIAKILLTLDDRNDYLFLENEAGETPLHFALQNAEPELINLIFDDAKKSPKTLMSFLYLCDTTHIQIPSGSMTFLIGSKNFSHEILDECISMFSFPFQKPLAMKILTLINNNETKAQAHNPVDRTNLSAYFRIPDSATWKLRAEYHKGDCGSAIYRACEYYESVRLAPINIESSKDNNVRFLGNR